MNIEIEVVGGTTKNTRSKLVINQNQSGELQMDRADFTKFCDLLFSSGYTIAGKSAVNRSD